MITFEDIKNKVLDGKRISEEDAVFLFESPDLLAIGQLADTINQQKNNNLTYYNVNRHVNPTNICALSCKFCAYSRKPGEEGGYEYSIDEILEKVQLAVDQDATEIHMVGGLHPRWRLNHFINILTSIKEKFPDIHLKGFTAVELDWLARRSKLAVKDLIIKLQEAGLDSLPGGGAEIFHQDIRDEITAKLSADEWIDIHRTAHGLGMHSNATMLYGHVENYAHRVDHMRYLRNLQDETGGFNAFIPLSFQPHNNEMGIKKYTFGADDLKTLAIARLYLDNFQHIKAYWIMLGQDIAQLGLNFGANDLDGTVTEEKISNMAGSQAGISMSRDQIEKLIIRTGHDACERDTLYSKKGEIKSAESTRKKTQPIAEPILAKSLTSTKLSPEEAMVLVQNASFYDLAITANKLTSKIVSSKQRSFGSSINIDLDNEDMHSPKTLQDKIRSLGTKIVGTSFASAKSVNIDVSQLTNGDEVDDNRYPVSISGLSEIITEIGKTFQNPNISLLGVKRLWQIAQQDQLLLPQAFQMLGKAGLSSIGSSVYESETGLTISEVVGIHRAAHNSGLTSIAQVEISSAHNGSELLWSRFLDRVSALDELNRETGKLMALCIEPSRDSNISITEFLEVTAITRILAKSVINISTSILSIPTMMNRRPKKSKIQTTEQKVGALALLCGASDLGSLTEDLSECLKASEEIRSAGFEPILRDNMFTSKRLQILASDSLQIRHTPELTR